ncbi:MAG: methyl-accepting chemotaxis protein [bacterium]
MKIKTKLIVSITIGSIFGGAIGAIGLFFISHLRSDLETLNQQQLQRMTQLYQVTISIQEYRTEMGQLIYAKTPEDRIQVEEHVKNRAVQFSKVLKSIEEATNSEKERGLIASIKAQGDQMRQHFQSLVDLPQANRVKGMNSIMTGPMDATSIAINQSLDQLLEMYRLSLKTVTAESTNAAQRAELILTLVLSLAVLSGLIWAFILAGMVTKPIHRLVKQIEEADLNLNLNSRRNDEIGRLMRAFDGFVRKIRVTITGVAEITDAVTNISAELSASTISMASGAEEQSTQATDVSASVEQMSKTILENSRNANVTVETATTAKKAAEEGGLVVEESIIAMKRIAVVVKQSAETVRALGKSSDQIGAIVSVIDDIADQTNLLALNAAIEAARAGEQGRGFAVVADEVRKLAERTTKATKEIAEMIRKIQKDTSEAVHSMEQGTKEVDQGIKLVDAAGTSLRTIMDVSHQVTEMVVHIASASEEQAHASESIAKSVEQISVVTQESAGGIQQISRATEDLDKLIESLRQLMSNFKITSAPESLESAHSEIPVAARNRYSGDTMDRKSSGSWRPSQKQAEQHPVQHHV